MEFTAITTQEQFDAAISERLKRERDSISKKYEDYDSLKTKVTDYEKQISDLGKSIDEQNQKYAGYDKNIGELQVKVKSYESNSVKMRIAHEAGLPFELAARLSGESEDDIKADAAQLSKLIGSGHTAPLKTSEPQGDGKIAALRALTQNLTKGE